MDLFARVLVEQVTLAFREPAFRIDSENEPCRRIHVRVRMDVNRHSAQANTALKVTREPFQAVDGQVVGAETVQLPDSCLPASTV